jgi:hypothetical protein
VLLWRSPFSAFTNTAGLHEYTVPDVLGETNHSKETACSSALSSRMEPGLDLIGVLMERTCYGL